MAMSSHQLLCDNTSVVRYHDSGVVNHQSGVVERQSGVVEPQSGVVEPQSGAVEHQSEVGEPQSEVGEQQSGVMRDHNSGLECFGFGPQSDFGLQSGVRSCESESDPKPDFQTPVRSPEL
eukprot:gene12481-biopygen5079